MNKQLNLWKEQSDDNKLLIAKLLDKIKFTKNKNKFETTDFLDLREQAILTEEINRIKFEQYKLWGGYDNSERKIILLFPEKIDLDYIDNTVFDQFLTIIRVKLPKSYVKWRKIMINNPTTKIIIPIILYTLTNKLYRDDIFSLSLSAIGLYIQNVIALPTPNSVKLSTCRIEVNKLFSPRYCTPIKYIIAVRIRKGTAIW